MSSAAGVVLVAEQHHDRNLLPFFSFPREVRDMIYPLVVGDGETYYQSRQCYAAKQGEEWNNLVQQDLRQTSNRLSISQACRVANEEANEILYKNNTFEFHLMSETWLRPQISQENADIMQHIRITLGFDRTSMWESVRFLQMFTYSQNLRQTCHILFDWTSPYYDISMIHPVFKMIRDLTTFQDLVIQRKEMDTSFGDWPRIDVEQDTLWYEMRRFLQSALGPCVTSETPGYHYLTFKPQEHLKQKGLSH